MNIYLDVHIENEGHLCRVEFDAFLVKSIKAHYVTSYSGDSGGEAWLVELYEPIYLFTDYQINNFLLNSGMRKIFLRQYKNALLAKADTIKEEQ